MQTHLQLIKINITPYQYSNKGSNNLQRIRALQKSEQKPNARFQSFICQSYESTHFFGSFPNIASGPRLIFFKNLFLVLYVRLV